MGAAPHSVVPAPPRRPPRVGLIAQLAVVDDLQNRWESGFTYAPENCAGAGVKDQCEIGVGRTVHANAATVDFAPFIVWAADKCSTLGFEARDFRGRASRLLLAEESKQIATELLKGTLAQAHGYPNWWLARPGSDVLSAAPATPIDALAALEEALTDNGGQQGLIHATRGTVTYWSNLNVIRREGNQYLTIHDTIVLPDAGYDGTGPGGVAPSTGHVWAYATDMMTVRRSSDMLILPLDDTYGDGAMSSSPFSNDITVYAERLAAVSWAHCVHAAVEINIPQPLVTGS